MKLRKGTIQNVQIGPFISADDGITPIPWESPVVNDGVLSTYIYLSKNGGVFTALSSGHFDAIGNANGWARLELTEEDTDTAGALVISVYLPGALSVWHEFDVISEHFYDAEYSATGRGVTSNMVSVANAALAGHYPGFVPVDIKRIDGAEIATSTAGHFPADVSRVEGFPLVDHADGKFPADMVTDVLVAEINNHTTSIGASIHQNINDGVPVSSFTLEAESDIDAITNTMTGQFTGVHAHLMEIETNINNGVPVSGEVDANVMKIAGSNLFAHIQGCFPVDLRGVDGATLVAHKSGLVPADTILFDGDYYLDPLTTVKNEINNKIEASSQSILSEISDLESLVSSGLTLDSVVDGITLGDLLTNLAAHTIGSYTIEEFGSGGKRVTFYKSNGVDEAFQCKVFPNSRVPV